MNNLAATLRDVGDLAGALSLHESVLRARGRILGAEHPDTLTAMSNFALTLRDLGDLAGARSLQESVVEGRRRILGERNPSTSISACNLLATLLDQGEQEAAGVVLRDHLAWLLAVDPQGLGAAHREIRGRLAQLLGAAPGPGSGGGDQKRARRQGG
jgi:hypothetical protein